MSRLPFQLKNKENHFEPSPSQYYRYIEQRRPVDTRKYQRSAIKGSVLENRNENIIQKSAGIEPYNRAHLKDQKYQPSEFKAYDNKRYTETYHHLHQNFNKHHQRQNLHKYQLQNLTQFPLQDQNKYQHLLDKSNLGYTGSSELCFDHLKNREYEKEKGMGNEYERFNEKFNEREIQIEIQRNRQKSCYQRPENRNSYNRRSNLNDLSSRYAVVGSQETRNEISTSSSAMYGKSAATLKKSRQNSKYLQFDAKVKNLDNISNNISGLLDFVKVGKGNFKQKKAVTQRPDICITPTNAKITSTYSNKTATPGQTNLPQSQFQPKSQNSCSKSTLKQQSSFNNNTRRSQLLKYSPSPYREREQSAAETTRQNLNLTAHARNRSHSPLNSKTAELIERRKQLLRREKEMLDKVQNKRENIALQLKKYGYQHQKLNTQKSQKKCEQQSGFNFQNYTESKLTSDHAPLDKTQLYQNDQSKVNTDLEFYYESLQNRDRQKIQNTNNLSKLEELKKLQIQLTQNKTQNMKRKSITKSPAVLQIQQRIKRTAKNKLFTEEQIEAYKEMKRSKLLSQQETSTPARTRSKILSTMFDDHENKDISKKYSEIKKYKNSASMKEFQNTQSAPKQRNQVSTSAMVQKRLQRDYSQRNIQNITNLQTTHALNDQINKIKQELKQSKQHKTYLRQRYDQLLRQQISQIPKAEEKSKNHTQRQSIQKDRCRIATQKKINFQKDKHPLTNQKTHTPLKQQITVEQKYANTKKVTFQQKNQTKTRAQSKKDQENFKKQQTADDKQRYVNIQCTKFDEQSLQKLMTDIRNKPNAKATTPKTVNLNQRNYLKPNKNSLQNSMASKTTEKMSSLKAQTFRLGSLFGQKVEIDMRLRQERQQFMRLEDADENTNKWEVLTKRINQELGVQRQTAYWKQLFLISSQEHNPFVKNEKAGQTLILDSVIQNVIQRYQKSLEFYQKNIQNKMSAESLKQQKFSFKSLDLSSKGYLSVEDLVCFVNLYTGKFYRNRDIIFLIKSILANQGCDIKELKSETLKIEYNQLWNQVTK